MGKLSQWRRYAWAFIVTFFCLALSFALVGFQLATTGGLQRPSSLADVPGWLSRAPNPWVIVNAGVAAVLATFGGLASWLQVFGPKPLNADELSQILKTDSDLTRA